MSLSRDSNTFTHSHILDDIQGFSYPRVLAYVLPNRLATLLLPTRVVQVDDDAVVVPGLAGENSEYYKVVLGGHRSKQMLMRILSRTAT